MTQDFNPGHPTHRNTPNASTSWSLVAWNNRVGLAAVRSYNEPGQVSFFLLGQSREDFPCGCCDAEDPCLPEYNDLNELSSLKMFLGLWPVEAVKAWCCKVLDSLKNEYAPVTNSAFNSIRHETIGLAAEPCSCRKHVLIFALGQNQCDLPCQTCNIDCMLIEDEPDDPKGLTARLPLARLSSHAIKNLCLQLFLLLENEEARETVSH